MVQSQISSKILPGLVNPTYQTWISSLQKVTGSDAYVKGRRQLPSCHLRNSHDEVG